MRTLVVCYSWTGHTRTLAQQISAALGADLEDIQETSLQQGVLRYLNCLLQALLHRPAPIADSQHNPADYDLVVIGTPVWAWNLSGPARAYIQRHREQLRKLALFCTCEGAGHAKVLADMQALCGKTPVATLGLTMQEMHDRFHHQRLEKFLQQIRQAEPAAAPTQLRPRAAF